MKIDYFDSKISLAECKKILNKENIYYADEEIIQMRDWLYKMADIAIDSYEMEEDKRKLNANKLKGV
jgi:hypothetical protein